MSELIIFREIQPFLFFLFVAAIGLSIGSFLNVLVFRLPLIIQSECGILLSDNNKYLTLGGRSYCPSCGSQIPWWLNIPVFSWLFIRGYSSCCNKKISMQYPVIEFICGLMAIIAFYEFDIVNALIVCFSFYVLLSLFLIDYKTSLLPDVLVFLFLWSGVLFNINGHFVSLEESVYGVVIGYLSMEIIPKLHILLSGKKNVFIGGGDVKLVSAAGAWLGPFGIPYVLLGAVFISILLFLLFKTKANKEVIGNFDQNIVPFGPGLCISIFGLIVFN